jgi:cell division transport system permease protein
MTRRLRRNIVRKNPGARISNESVKKTSHLSRVSSSFFTRHFQAAFLSLGQLVQKPLTSSMICIVIAIALALPMGLYVMLENTKTLSKGWGSSSPIMLYLVKEQTDEQAKSLGEEIATRAEVASVTYVSPEQGLADFEAKSGLGNMLSTLPENPLPGLLIVTPASNWRTPESMAILLESLKVIPQVEMAQLDIDWVQRLDAFLNLGARFVYGLSLLLALGVIIIIGSIIHLVTQNHKEEIFVYELVGASKAFIRRPFLYTGMWYGLIGSLLACILISVFFLWLGEPSKLLGQLYGGGLLIKGLSIENILSLLGIGVFLGVFGSWAVVHKHLAV